MTNAETFLNIFSGAQNKYGKCYKYIKETGEKLTIEETGLIPIELHLNGVSPCQRALTPNMSCMFGLMP